MYIVDLQNVVPQGGLTCLFAKATPDESNLWHRRLGHVNFKTMNKLVRGNLVRGLPLKLFEINQTYVSCHKGKQHRASCKTKTVSSISQPLQMLHMDLFGPTFVKSLMKKMYCLVVTDDFSRFSWVFFLATKDETNEILKTFITGIENLIDLRVKVIRCDNGTKFKNRVMNQFCEMKGIKREFSVARTPQQNGVAEKKNRNTKRLLGLCVSDSITNNFLGRKLALSFMRPFGCHVTILNTIDHLGKFDGKADEGFFVGYSTNSKAFRVFNSRTRIVEENLHVQFSKNTPNIARSGPNWLFDIDALTKSMNYKPVVVGNQSNGSAGTKACDNAGKARVETDSPDAGFKPSREEKKKDIKDPGNDSGNPPEGKDSEVPKDNVVDENIVYGCADDLNIPNLEEIGRFSDAEDDGAKADMTNLDIHIPVRPIPTTRIHKDHPVEQIIRDIHSAPQTRRMTKSVTEHAMFKPKKVIQALKDPSWIEAMQDELLRFKLQQVWTLVDLPHGKRVIGTKWVYRNKKDERGIVIRNKARLVAQGHTQEEGIDYDEVFAPVSRIEAIRLFLAYASYKDFVVYQMDMKSAFLYGKIEEEVYVCQPLGFEDPDFPDRVYKVEKALYGLHQAPRAWYETLSTYLLENRFQRGQIDKTLFIKRDQGDILIVQVYVDDIIFGSTKKKLCTEFEKMMHKKFQMSSIGKLTFFLVLQVKQKEDGIFISQDKFQVNPKVSHLHAVKRIVRYIKGQPKLDLWYLKDSPFDLVAYTDSDYAGASLDRKSTTEDSNEKKLIQMIKIHTDKNVADFLTKAFNKGIGVNVGDLKLMLLGINLLLQGKVNAARHNLLLLVLTTLGKWGGFDETNGNDENIIQNCLIGEKKREIKELVRITIDDGNAFWKEIWVDAGVLKLMLRSVYAARHTLPAVRHKLMLPGITYYCWHLEGGVKFLMYPRFVQVFLNKQVMGMTRHKEVYVTPSHTKKVFANMKRPCKGFSGEVNTSLLHDDGPSYQKNIAKEITSLKKRVKQLEKRRKLRTSGQEVRKGGCIQIRGRKIEDLDADTEVTLVNETQEMNDDNLMFDTGVLEEQEIKFEKVVEEPVVSVATTTKLIPVSATEVVTTASVEIPDEIEFEKVVEEPVVSVATTTKSIPISAVKVVTTANVEIPDELTLAQTLIEIKTAKPKPVTTVVTTVTSVRPRDKGIIFHDQEEQVPASTKSFSSSNHKLPQVKDKGKGKNGGASKVPLERRR
ncbi:ribonuclease H-like domain-containing protein [Tanacetum coccineum]